MYTQRVPACKWQGCAATVEAELSTAGLCQGAGAGGSSCASRLCLPGPSGLHCHGAQAMQYRAPAGLAATLLGSTWLLTLQSCARWAGPRTRKGRRCAGRRCMAVGGAVDGGGGWHGGSRCGPGTVQVVEQPCTGCWHASMQRCAMPCHAMPRHAGLARFTPRT